MAARTCCYLGDRVADGVNGLAGEVRARRTELRLRQEELADLAGVYTGFSRRKGELLASPRGSAKRYGDLTWHPGSVPANAPREMNLD